MRVGLNGARKKMNVFGIIDQRHTSGWLIGGGQG